MRHAIHGVHAPLNTQLPRVIAERAIHHVVVMDGRNFGQSNETYCWQAKSRPLTKNAEYWYWILKKLRYTP